jgi:hypothetical protein
MKLAARKNVEPVLDAKVPPVQKVQAQSVLYVGPHGDEFGELLAKQIGMIDIGYCLRISEAMMAARAKQYDVLIIDQRDDNLATRLIVPLMASLGNTSKLVVVSKFNKVGDYLAIPGVARVLTAPVKEAQLLRLLGLTAPKAATPAERVAAKAVEKKDDVPKTSLIEMLASKIPQFNRLAAILSRFSVPALTGLKLPGVRLPTLSLPSVNIWGWAMTLVSNLYKRAAFVLLTALFSAFVFYGLLIAFFLMSSGWAAPLTLVRGHELVLKAESDLTRLKVEQNQADQRLSEALHSRLAAERNLEDARMTVTASIASIKSEISMRQKILKAQSSNIKRLEKTRSVFQKSMAQQGKIATADELFEKRLIDRKTYDAASMGNADLSQRDSLMESQMESAQVELDNLVTSIEMLKALAAKLEGKAKDQPASAPPDLLLLAKQALEANSMIAASKSQIEASKEAEKNLLDSKKVLKSQIVALESSAVGRALEKRIDVLFVPYNNLASFKPGTPLYSCAVTIVFCSKAGTTGKTLPGESSYVHPFFGKPIRGVFVEVDLSFPDAAAREIIHAKRSPLFI